MKGDGRELRRQVQTLVRRLGVLATDATPCGYPLPVSDAHALMLLLEHGELAQTALETLLGIDKSNVSRLRRRLEDDHRVRARPAIRHGRRISLLALTEKGTKLARELELASGRRFTSLSNRLASKERSAVVAALKELNRALEEMNPQPVHDVSHQNALSPRQREVSTLVAGGMTSRQIAERLSIGVRTVESHRALAMRRLRELRERY